VRITINLIKLYWTLLKSIQKLITIEKHNCTTYRVKIYLQNFQAPTCVVSAQPFHLQRCTGEGGIIVGGTRAVALVVVQRVVVSEIATTAKPSGLDYVECGENNSSDPDLNFVPNKS